MPVSFRESASFLLTSESVTEGHPDKICDQVSDAILDAMLEQDPMSRVACETACTTGLVVVMGEITTKAQVDIPALVRETIRRIGYDDPDFGFDGSTCGVQIALDRQSADISAGVSQSLETRGKTTEEDAVATLGAGDQGMMIGFACNETAELMPLPINLSHGITHRMSKLRKDGVLPYLRPDGKSQVTVDYEYGIPKRVHTVIMSSQHSPDVTQEQIRADLIEHVAKAVIPEHLLDGSTRFEVNPSGRFVIGGPVGDSGLTGRKIIVDTYGGAARHGGGAFSGKDPTKVDRSAAYAARWVAKNLIAAGVADRLELQLSYAIGVAEPISISVETFGTNEIPDEDIVRLVRKHFDLRPGAIIRDLGLRRPIYHQTAAFGHFGRDDLDLPWESTDKAPILRAEAGLRGTKDERAVSA